MSVATGTAIALAVGAGTAGASIYAANKQSGAAQKAAQAQTSSANYAADVQAKSAQDTLEWTKQQAAQARLDADATQRANYEQWAAAQRYQNAQQAGRTSAINALGAQYGVAPRANPDMTIPAYVSSLGAAAAGPPTGAPGAVAGPPGTTPPPTGPSTSAGPTVSAAGGDIGAQVSNYFKSRGVSDAETPYWVQKWAEFGVKDPAYFNRRLAAADVFGGGGAPVGAPAGARPPGTIAAAFTPSGRPIGASAAPPPGWTPPPVTAPLTVTPYQRRTVRDYFG